MKVTHAETHVLGSGGLQEATTFKIRTSPHAFRMLSSGLYSDKVSAVLREIGCNGQDAHIAAGCPTRPIEVKLPNQIDSQFYIRDHGTGLSDEEVKDLYTTYFASSKQESNDYTGAFGLGSKSPFSYTDAFTVISCHGGKKRVYSAHIDNKTGSPVIALMSEMDADPDWKTGIQVGFPVKPSDFYDFQTKAKLIFRHFNPVPTIHGAPPIKPMKIDADFGDYAYLDKDDEDCKDQIFVLMGNVRYPLSLDKLNIAARWSTKGKLADYIWGLKGLLLRFKIGELQVAASREELQYDPDTQKVLRDRLEAVVKSVVNEIHSAWMKATTWAEICEFKDMAYRVGRGIDLDEKLFELNGIKTHKELAAACRNHGLPLPTIPQKPKASYSLVSKDDKSEHFKIRVKRPYYGDKLRVEFDKNLSIIWGAEDRALARVREAFRREELEGTVVLVATNTKEKGDASDVDALYKEVATILPGVPAKDLSNYAAPPIIRSGKRKKGTPLPDDDVVIDGKKTKMSDVDDDRKIYIPVSVRRNWGNVRTWRILGKTAIDSYRWDQISHRINILNKQLKTDIKEPVEIQKADIKRLKMADRTDWKDYITHVKGILEDKTVLAELKKQSVSGGVSVDVSGYRSGWQTGLLENLVNIKQHRPAQFKVIIPILDKHGILDKINEVHKNSVTGVVNSEPQVLSAFKAVAQALDLTIETPEYKIVTLDINTKYSYASARTYDQLNSMFGIVPSLYPQIIDELLSKGTSPV